MIDDKDLIARSERDGQVRMDIKVVAIGGVCTGKTTILNRLIRELASQKELSTRVELGHKGDPHTLFIHGWYTLSEKDRY